MAPTTLCSMLAAANAALAVGGAACVPSQNGPGRFALSVDGQPAPWFVSECLYCEGSND